MTKVKSNASWNGLSPKQRRTLETWLFDEKLGYQETLERAKKELGFKGAMSSLRRFYRRTSQERLLAGFTEAEELAEAVDGAAASTERLRGAGMKIIGQMFLKQAAEGPEKAKEWGLLAKLLLQSEENELRRKLQGEENAIKRGYLEFSRQRFHYDAMAAARKALPELLALAEAEEEAKKSPETRKFEENKATNDVIRRMFGEAVPELWPETPEEEAHPEIIQRKLDKAHEREAKRYAREAAERKKELAEMERKRKAEMPPDTLAEEPVEEGEPESSGEDETQTATEEVWEDKPADPPSKKDEVLEYAYRLRRANFDRKGPMI
jgi:hypothetical protein